MAQHCNFIRLICACLCLPACPVGLLPLTSLVFAAVFSLVFSPSTCQAQDDFLRQLNPNYGQSPSSGSRFPQSDPAPARFDSTPYHPNTHRPDTGYAADYNSPTYNTATYNAATYNAATYNAATYNAARIEGARRTALQYRARDLLSLPQAAELSATNAELVDQWVELAEAIVAISNKIANTQLRLQFATRDYQDVIAKLQQNQTTAAIGQLLSHKRNQLDDWLVDGSAAMNLNDELLQARQKQLESSLLGYDGKDVLRQTNELLAGLQIDPNSDNYSRVSMQIQSLLGERAEWLRLLKQGYSDYRQRLGDLDSISNSLNRLIGDYRRLIARQVIWIRSNDALGLAELQKVRAGLSAVFSSRRSFDLGYSLRQKWQSDPAAGVILILSLLSILTLRSVAKHWLIGIGKRKKMREYPSSSRKCMASLLTVFVALAVPAALYLMARWLGMGYVTESTLPVSSALYAASLVALTLEVPRQLLRRFGFIEKHLHVDLPRQQRATIYLATIGFGLVLAAYVVTLAGRIDHAAWSGSVARLGFIASMLLVAWTAHLALKPRRGFLEPIIERFGGAIFSRIRVVFYLLAVGFPLGMIAISILGYDFTATEITQRAAITLSATLIAATLWAAVKIVASRAWHKLTGTRDDRQLDDYAEPTTAAVSGVLAARSLELKHQLAFLSQCALVLAAIASVGWLWIDIFPNVRLGNPVLWIAESTTTQSMVDASGQTVLRSVSQANPITLLHLVLAVATLFVAFQIAKLLPSIFDALILQRVNFDEAMEHLALMLGRCVLFGIGCVVAFRLVGIRWEVVQWLAVGLSIGIGFGLQDIVKNLLGGIVVLFEKPARLGDLITVGNVTGRVSSQKLRTTTLSDVDGREVIVPNKNFMSQKVVNWLGAGRLKAIPIEVTVNRDQRPADLCRMLQQLMVKQPELLLSPAPQATLICVGQQSQRIGLLAWVEEDQDAARYRETLLKIVLTFLDEKNLLAAHQPRQPSLDGSALHSAAPTVGSTKRRTA